MTPNQPLRRLRLRIRRSRWARWAVYGGAALLLVLFVAGLWLIQPFWQLSGQFDDHPSLQPSRVYARSTILQKGGSASLDSLTAELAALGYREVESARPPHASYYREKSRLAVHLRSFPTPQGLGGGQTLVIEMRGRRVDRLLLDEEEVPAALLEPPLLASFYGEDVKDRWPIQSAELPETLVQAVLAAEDERFFRHSGVSFRGIARAALANLKDGEVRQGGSTLTQQLVKNLYLSHERTVSRKAREALLALLLEARYSKREILRAYLNEIYLGTVGGVNIHGMGSAARAYFGKHPDQLSLAEAATLASMIPAPAAFSPLVDPDRARERRNAVLRNLQELETLPAEQIAQALEEPLITHPFRPVRRRAPYFVGAVAQEAERRFGITDLEDGGYLLLSTLSWKDQQDAEEAVRWGLEALEKGWEKGSKVAGPLQSALVSVDPRDGAVLAYVGGRDYGASQFDRAGLAQRQAGSAFKPVVYATALETGTVTPSSMLLDDPLTVTLAGQRWSPRNDGGEFSGWVTARQAVERSLNVPTARVALATGLPKIVEVAHAMGVTAELKPYPSLALGAFEVTPLELTSVYATLAGEGRRPPLHGLLGVFDRQGKPMAGEPLPESAQVLSPQSTYLLTSILQGVLDRGTASAVRRWGLQDALAGKSGTTNDRRDSWFAGYAPNRATVVWVGYDDNSSTRLSGSRAGLPIWARFTQKVRPAVGYPSFRQPPGITTALVDPESGQLATEDCPQVLTEVFREGQVPTGVCSLHRSWYAVPLDQPDDEIRPEERRPLRRWLRRVFGNDRDEEHDRGGGRDRGRGRGRGRGNGGG